eukprot:XP_001708808.1 Dynein heavy chain [Giardia lamblia ATCC 50803]
MSRQDTPARREGAPRHASSAEYFMELVRAQEHASRQTPHLSDQLFTYNEEEYAPFDLDPVRPAHITPADETLDCACTRTLGTGECTIRGAPGSLLHRLEMHSEASLPPGMLKNARPAIISNASKTLRTRNAETKKIITSERLVGGMKTGADVIAYFARTPDKAVVKIVYCSPTTTPVDKVYNPYSLRVIDGDVAKKLPVYYTISQNGVMRVVNSDVKVLKVYDMINDKSTLNPSLYKLEKTVDKNLAHPLRQDGIPGGTDTDFFALDPCAGSDGASDGNDATSRVHCDAVGDASSNDGFQHRSSGIDTGIRGDKSHRRKPEQTDPNILSRTIESDLVTAFHDDASEFTMLDRWILEASNFDILRNYKFFKHFYQLKTLQTWIAFRKYKRYCRNRKSITKSLFLSRPHFLQSLKTIWAILYDIKMSQCIDLRATSNTTAPKRDDADESAISASAQGLTTSGSGDVPSLPSGIAQPLQAWKAAQIHTKRTVSESLDAANDSILTEITALCNELRKRASDDDEMDQAKLPLFMRQKIAKVKSITATKAEQLHRRRAIQQAQFELVTISDFIVLCDFLYNEAMLEMIYASTLNLANAVANPPPATPGLIISEIFFQEIPPGKRYEEIPLVGDVQFNPPLHEIQATLLDSVSEAINVCSQQTHLSQLAALREYFILANKQLPNPQNISTIASNDAEVQAALKVIRDSSTEQIAKLEAFSKSYSQLYPIHAFLSTWNEELYAAKFKDTLSCDLKLLLPSFIVNPTTNKKVTKLHSYLKNPPNPQQVPLEDRRLLEDTFESARAAYGTRPLERQITIFRGWSQILSRMAANTSTGFTQLDARSLLQTLQPVPLIGLKAVENTALSVLRNLVSKCTTAFKTHTKVLSIEPKTLTEFCNYIEYNRSIDKEIEHLISEVQLADDILIMLTSPNNLQSTPPNQMFVAFDVSTTVDDLFTMDAKLNPSIPGLGLKVSVSDRTSVDTLHGELQVLQNRRALADQLVKDQHYVMASSLKEMITTTTNDINDIRLTLLSGSACDSNADPRSVVSHIDELSATLNDMTKHYGGLSDQNDILTGWYNRDAEAEEDEDEPEKPRTKKEPLKLSPGQNATPSQLVCMSNIETLTELKGTIAQIKQDLDLRSRMWKRMHEWRIFEDRLMVSSWIDTVINCKLEEAEPNEAGVAVASAVEGEKDAAEGEAAADDALDAHDESADDTEKKVDPIVAKFKYLSAETCLSFINEATKDSTKFARLLPEDGVAAALKRAVTSMKQKSQLIADLGNINLKPRHWEKIFETLKPFAKEPGSLSYNSGFSFETLLDAGVLNKRAEIASISATASGERNIELSLEKIRCIWEGTVLAVKEYSSRSGVLHHIISGVEEIYQQLEDSTSTLQAMAGSRYIAGIKPAVESWEKKLSTFAEVLDEWCKMQQTWLYLESIFAPDDIRRQLPRESADFSQVDAFWQKLMETVASNPCIMTVVDAGIPNTPLANHDLLKELTAANEKLEVIQKRLEDYLESKRLAFPRFFFLSNDELLQILAQTTEPSTVRPFLRKIFEAIGDIELEELGEQPLTTTTSASAKRRKRMATTEDADEDEPSLPASGPQKKITAMISPEGEKVMFVNCVVPSGGLVEVWLTALEKEMVNTVRYNMYHTLSFSPRVGEQRKEWMFDHPAQCVMAAGQAVWCNGVEEALLIDAEKGSSGREAMERFSENLLKQINELVSLTMTDLSSQQRGLISTLIVLEVHSRDVTSSLLDSSSENYCLIPSEFGWLKQLRYYWHHNDKAKRVAHSQLDSDEFSGDLVIRQTNSFFTCGYEYMGISTRLVLTPLTDRCFITLTSALANFMGGAPQGPAGTGKTESTKDLAKAMSIQCLVFNCSEGLNVAAMGKFFIGLVMCGAWSCFDEFNRIEVEVLSVVASQILCIQTAILTGADHFLFNAGGSSEDGLDISVGNGDPTKRCGIFITMNPGYAGRVELPDNLKALFRPISMVVPNYALIAEIILFSEGFTTAKVLSRKMVQLYKLSSEQLSHQSHYDFGMRAIKSVLVMAGGLRRKYIHLSEDIVLIQAMRDANLPKFLVDDIELFMGIIQDLFPGVQIPSVEHGGLHAEIVRILSAKGLQPCAEYVSKILQIYDTHIIRHGLMTVGDTLTGKTVARNVLADAITAIAEQRAAQNMDPDGYHPVAQYVLNSKAVTMPELYGEFNSISHDWTDGLIAVIARKMIDPNNAHLKHWICFDSPVDALWIENLNTTLDDNKMICLANGERIRLHNKVNLFFEVADLSQASPATVSRCGMIYFSDDFIGYNNLLKSLIVDNCSNFAQKVLALVCLEEFSLDLFELRDAARVLMDSTTLLPDEEDENIDEYKPDLPVADAHGTEPLIDNQSPAQSGDAQTVELSVPTYPRPLRQFQTFEQLLHKLTVQLLARLHRQLCMVYPKVISFLRNDCREEMRTVDFQLVFSLYQILEAAVSERVAFTKDKVAEIAMQKKIQEQYEAASAINRERVQSASRNTASSGAPELATGQAADTVLAEKTAISTFLERLPPPEVLTSRAMSGIAPVVSIILEQRIIFAIAWGLAGSIVAEHKINLDKFLRTLLTSPKEFASSGDMPAEISSLAVALPPDHLPGGQPASIYDWKLDNQTRGYSPWDTGTMATLFGSKKFDPLVLQQGGSVYDMIVPTPDFIKMCAVTQSLLRNGNNIFLCGPTGTSKTSIVKTIFNRCIGNIELNKKPAESKKSADTKEEEEPTAVVPNEEQRDFTQEAAYLNANTLEFPMSAQTRAAAVENAIIEKMEKKRKTLFCPANQRKSFYVFIDDSTMPTPDTYGSQPPIEILRQIISESGCYDRQKLVFRTLEGLQFLCASQPPGGGRNEVTRRFSGKFVVLSCPELTDSAMISIFGNLLQGFMASTGESSKTFSPEVRKSLRTCVEFVVRLYSATKQEIRATPLKSHYSFNVRDIARVVGGVFSTTPDEVTSLPSLVTLLVHESYRVFRDRLVDDKDCGTFDKVLLKNIWYFFEDRIVQFEQKTSNASEDGKKELDEGAEEDEYYIELDFEEPVQRSDDEVQRLAALEQKVYTDEELGSMLERINLWTGCPIQCTELIYGRWANPGGTYGDGVYCPYRNLFNQTRDVENCLNYYVDSISEVQEDPPPSAGAKSQVDFQELLDNAIQNDDSAGSARLVMFHDAILHFSRLFRVITQPRGHMLMIGLSGSGRRSLVRLAAFAAGAKVVYPAASKLYGLNEFNEDLKRCMLTSGCENVPTILLLSESQLDPHDHFLEILNGILNGVALPMSLWKPDEKEKIMQKTIELASVADDDNESSSKRSFLPHELWQLFYRNARSNFHVCLCLSPIGESLRRRLRMFPALSSCMTIDWFANWNAEALAGVAMYELNSIHPAFLGADQSAASETPTSAPHSREGKPRTDKLLALKQSIAEACVVMHGSTEASSEQYFAQTKSRIYITPPLFLSFIRLFKRIFAKSVGKLKVRESILQSGLTKLVSTREQVSEMQKTLTNLQPVLADSVAKTEALLVNLSSETEEVNKIRTVVQAEEQEVAKVAAEAEEIKDDAQRDLDTAMPAFNAAINSLKSLNKNDISELKSFKSPPELVRYVMEAVCILMETPKQDWDTAQKVLSKTDFLQSLMTFDKDNIKPKTLRSLRKYTQNPDFDPAKVEKVSKAAKSLCMWCRAIDIYAKVFAEIEPKRERLAQAEQTLKTQQEALAVKQKDLAAIVAKLDALQASYDESIANRTRLESEIEETQVRLDRAEKLIAGLANEYDAWIAGIADINQRLKTAIGDALLGAGYIAYLGPFSADERGNVLAQWKATAFNGIDFSPNFALTEYPAVADPREIRNWKEQCTLPSDNGSVESAIIATQGTRFSLLIDPECQGVRFLKRLEEKNGLQLTSGTAVDNMMRTLENSIRLGSPVLIENLQDDIDGSVMSVLRKELIKKGGQCTIKIGENEVEYNPDFNLYLATRKRQPNYNPDIQSSASVVNMAVSSKGLEEQLLSLVVTVEDAQLEREKDTIASQLAEGRETLTQLQDKLLDMLANATGNLLDDENLINALQDSKQTQKRIDEQVVNAEQTAKRVDALRERFRPVAQRGRILYEVIASLSTLDSMYIYSLDFFKMLFTRTLSKLQSLADETSGVSHAAESSRRSDNRSYIGTNEPSASAGLLLDDDEQSQRNQMAESNIGVPDRLLAADASFESDESAILQRKIGSMISAITEAAYGAICRGIFEKHKRIFSFMVAVSIQRASGALTGREWAIFKNVEINEKQSEVPDDFYSHMLATLQFGQDGSKYANINAIYKVLHACLAYDEFLSSSRDDPEGWKAWLESDDLELVVDMARGNYNGKRPFSLSVSAFIRSLAPFQRLMLLKAINPGRLMFYIPQYIADTIGEYYVQPPQFRMEQAYLDTSFSTPTIFVLSAGTDPHAQLVAFSKEKGADKGLRTLSLGQGQGVIAERMLARAIIEGDWVCLQNCHLCLSWMPNLARFVENLATMDQDGCDITGAAINRDFRLFLTSLPTSKFPQSVLSSSVKISHEPPRGLKANLILSYMGLTEELHDSVPEAPAVLRHWHRLIFGVAFFYSSLLERKRFGSVAYNNPYEFSIPDLEISRKFIRQYLVDSAVALQLTESTVGTSNILGQSSGQNFLKSLSNAVPYQTLQYMVGVIAFGGRVTDSLDQRCINAILSCIINPELFTDQPELFLEEGQESKVSPSGKVYKAPNPEMSLASTIEWLTHEFPVEASPSLFGLHANAELTYQHSEANLIVDSVLSMSPKEADVAIENEERKKRIESAKAQSKAPAIESDASSKGQEPEIQDGGDDESMSPADKQVLKFASSLFDRIPADLLPSNIHIPPRISVVSNGKAVKMPSPLYAVLKQESERYNKLLALVRVAFQDVGKAIKGLAIMSPQLEDVYQCILLNKIPRMITDVCYPTLKPLSSWIVDLIDRVQFMADWIELDREKGVDYRVDDFRWQIKGYVPKTFWIGAFFFPHGLLTAELQHYSRIEGIPIDALAISTTVLTTTEVDTMVAPDRNDPGLIITGLYVESAQWDAEAKELTEPVYGQMITSLGPVWFAPCTELDKEKMYAMPLYTTTLRYGVLSTTGTSTNYVLNMHLPTSKDPRHWILRGAAAFIQRSD